MTAPTVDDFARSPAAYVHIPFCKAICPYCDFAVVSGVDDLIAPYVDAVIAEIKASEVWEPLESVYFGGGTPSYVDPGGLARILDALDSHHGIVGGAEISLEANPEDFDERAASRLSDIGFSRVSFGAQSFDDEVLRDLGRRHGHKDIQRAVESARHAGFGNLSLDLILGSPGESDRSWTMTLDSLLTLEIEHVSCYALTVERGTPLSRAVLQGAPAPDPDVQADRYDHADARLSANGFQRYEVSNWARPGYECRYNLTVWAQGEYEAYGSGAHRFRQGVRSRNHRRLDAYISQVEDGVPPIAGEDEVKGWDAEIDRLFVGLRRAAGVSAGPGVDALITSPEGRRLIDAGVIAREETRLVVMNPLLTDAVNRVVVGLAPPQGWVEPVNTDNV